MAKKKSKKKVTKKTAKKKPAKIDPAVHKHWLEKVKRNGYAIKDAPKNLRFNREIVLAAVKQYGGALLHAADVLKSDPEIVFEAVKSCGGALEFVDKSLKSDPKIVLIAVQDYGQNLRYADISMRSDPKIVIAAFKERNDGCLLEYASKSMKSDPKIVLTAVKLTGEALQFADKSMKSNSKIVLAAVKQQGLALEYASKSLRSDSKIVLTALTGAGWALEFASKSMKSSPKIVLKALKNGWNGMELEYASKSLRNNPEIVLAALKENNDGSVLQYASKKLRSDPKIINVALSKSPDAIQYADESYTANQIIVVDDVQSNGTKLDFNSVGFKIGIKKNLGVPVKCSASYGPVCTLEKEDGVFSGVGEESIDVKGYIIWDESTWGDLIWELPKSTEDCIDAIKQESWVWCEEASESSIAFDECTFHENGSGANAGEMAANEDVDISDLDPGDFQCEDASFIEMSTSSSPETITIEYDSGFKIELASNRNASHWKAKLNMDSTTVSIGILKYENVLKVVRHWLEEGNPKNTFDLMIAKLLELKN